MVDIEIVERVVDTVQDWLPLAVTDPVADQLPGLCDMVVDSVPEKLEEVETLP